MFHANEVRPGPHSGSNMEISDRELSMARALIKGYEGEFDPTQFKDLYQERIRKLIDAEGRNRIETHQATPASRRGAPDLMEQIRLSLSQIEKRSDAKPSKKPVRKTPAVVVKKKPQRLRA